jgi:hypothetical protein
LAKALTVTAHATELASKWLCNRVGLVTSHVMVPAGSTTRGAAVVGIVEIFGLQVPSAAPFVRMMLVMSIRTLLPAVLMVTALVQ